MQNQQVAQEYLDHYFGADIEPDFAIMLEGPWGSGKSHFIKTYFEGWLEKLPLENSEAKNPFVHVSLFGVRKFSDIDSRIFAKAHPLLGGKTGKLVNFFGSKIASSVGLSSDPDENDSLLREFVLDLEGRILVFDDFERCPLPLVEVMGYINQFIEHDKLKVIVVASEQDIPHDQKEEYRLRKEKLIGKTIQVGSNPSEVLDVFVDQLRSIEAINTVNDQRENLLSTIHASGSPNFRSLRAILLDYDRLVTLADERLRSNSDAMAKLLLYMVAVGVEYRKNLISDAALRCLTQDFGLFGPFHIPDDSNDKTEHLCDRLEAQYPLVVSWSDPIVPSHCIADIFSSGVFDLEAVDVHLSQHPGVVGHTFAPIWRRMWSWYEYSQSEYAIIRAELLDQLERGLITEPGQFLHIAGAIIELNSYGEKVLAEDEPHSFFKDYIARIENAGTLKPASELFTFRDMSYWGLVYRSHDTDEFLKVHSMVQEASDRALSRQMKLDSSELIEKLKSNPKNVSMLYERGISEGNYGGVAILNYISVTDFAAVFLVDGKVNVQLSAALQKRYELGQNDGGLDAEFTWFANLEKKLKKITASLSPPHKKYVEDKFNWFFKFIEQQIERIQSMPPL